MMAVKDDDTQGWGVALTALPHHHKGQHHRVEGM